MAAAPTVVVIFAQSAISPVVPSQTAPIEMTSSRTATVITLFKKASSVTINLA
jgi:hypothetical protein